MTRCDQCDRELDTDAIVVRLPGWESELLVCSDRCKRKIERRVERPERSSTLPPPPKGKP